MGRFLPEALNYAERGWCVIPVRLDANGNKKPACRTWKPYQDRRPGAETLRRWFSRDGLDGVAVVLGPVSGGLVCRDFDVEDAYHTWATAHPDLAQTLPTARTGRGYHVYFRNGHQGIRKLGDGELRGKGGYCLLPPSSHPSGRPYVWKVEPNGSVPEVQELDSAGLSLGVRRPSCGAEVTQINRYKGVSQGACPGNPQGVSHEDGRGIPRTVEKAIDRTLPQGPGQRNHALFRFLILLKAMPEFSELKDAPREPVEHWHAAALPIIGTKDFSVTWKEAQYGWRRIQPGTGFSGAFLRAWDRATACSLTMTAETLTEWRIRLLALVCRECQRALGDRPFPMACKVGPRLGVTRKTGGKYLQKLVRRGVLRRITRGDFAGRGRPRDAATYRYVATEAVERASGLPASSAEGREPRAG